MSTFCSLPWIHLATHPDGNLSLCCEARTDLPRADGKNLSRDSIYTTFNSEFFRKARLEMLAGQRPEACRGCFVKEDRGIQSKRQMENEKWKLKESDARALTQADGSVSPDFRFVELRLGNLCNLKCRSCAPHSSSKWTGEYEKIREKADFLFECKVDDGFSWPDRPEFWDELLEAAPRAELLYINGGEPLLSLRHWEFLRRLIERGVSHRITLDYSTNMTVFHKNAAELWPRFKAVNIRASIDDVGERNAYIRHPANWKKVEATLEQMRSIPKVNLYALQTVSAMNFYYLDELHAWCENKNVFLVHNYVRDGEHLRPDSIPLPVRLEALGRFRSRLPKTLFEPLEKMWSLEGPPGSWEKCVRYTRALDESRGESFQKTFPEFANTLARGGYEIP